MELDSAKKVVDYLKKRLKEVGIIVVDASIYPKKGEQVIVMAGYLPGKACIFTIHANFYGDRRINNNFKFEIIGQLLLSKENLAFLRLEFDDVARTPVQSQSYSYCDASFDINHYTGYSMPDGTAQKSIEAGMAFYRNFLNKYGSSIEKRFLNVIQLWFVPENSDQLRKLEKKNGKYSQKNYDPFNLKVMAKFPKGLLAKNQQR